METSSPDSFARGHLPIMNTITAVIGWLFFVSQAVLAGIRKKQHIMRARRLSTRWHQAGQMARPVGFSAPAILSSWHFVPIAPKSIPMEAIPDFDLNSEASEESPKSDAVALSPLIQPPGQMIIHPAPSMFSESVPSSVLLSLDFILGQADASSDYKMVLQDGQDVGVFLENDESFFLDLPFLDSVLPSMAAGEQLFVPLYIQKILLPTWYGRRFAHTTKHFHLEQQIIALAKQQFSPALSEYIRLVYYAHLLSTELFLEGRALNLNHFSIHSNPKTTYFASFIQEFVGVDPRNFTTLSQAYLTLKLFIRENESKISALVMIGLQWGFNVRNIAQNIMDMMLFYQFTEDSLLMAVFTGAVMPALNPATVITVHWSMKPAFEVFKIINGYADGRYYKIFPKVNYTTRSGQSDASRRVLSEEEKAEKLTEIIMSLREREAYVAPTSLAETIY